MSLEVKNDFSSDREERAWRRRREIAAYRWLAGVAGAIYLASDLVWFLHSGRSIVEGVGDEALATILLATEIYVSRK